MPVMERPTMRVCMVSAPSKVWIASRSTMCRPIIQDRPAGEVVVLVARLEDYLS
jgi:hypothetical protein